jgi:hypothetical protein
MVVPLNVLLAQQLDRLKVDDHVVPVKLFG